MSTSQWKNEYRQALRTAKDLLAAGLIEPAEAPAFDRVIERYSLFLPRYYANLIERGNRACPIRLQALPDPRELENSRPQASSGDPLGDKVHRPVPRITHRYRGRALLHLTVNCPMYCRYCFRKTLLNEDSRAFFDGRLEEALRYIETRCDLEEIILSGGDPLMVGDEALGDLFARLDRIAHLKRIRIHTRAPVTMPARIDEALLRIVAATRLPVIVVTHFNHPREVTEESRGACRALKAATHALLNQSVLLKGVNDDVATLKQLFESVLSAGVLPYYLHQLDQAMGTLHFEVPIEEGRRIFAALKRELPGYLVPRYVVDEGDSLHKTWL